MPSDLTLPLLTARSPDLTLARRCLLEAGEVPGGLLDEALSRSWQRSRHAGLSPVGGPVEPPLCSDGELRRALSSERDFLAQARPVMDFVFDQMRDSGSLVVLSDARGLLLHSRGDADFLGRADRVSLRPGALWHESDRGTNAIGTALAEARPVVIHGAEHYLERNGFLTCAAAPVFGPRGQLRGVLDISGDHRGQHPHTFALVRSAARMIEDRLFHARHGHDKVLRLHPQVEGLGGVGEGLLALSEDGWVVGANTLAQRWLGLPTERIGACTLEQLTGIGLGLWPPGKVRALSWPAGGVLHARLDGTAGKWVAQHAVQGVTQGVTRSEDLVDAQDAGPVHPSTDRRVAEAEDRARRVQAQGIAVLIQGESGTGKEVLARTLHEGGARAKGPFVAVNCAALPEALIEAELFGYVGGAFTGARREGATGRIREAHGGTLFLDEIGDMPASLQARLLRVLQDKAVVPVGGTHAVPVDFLLVSATHRKLKEAIQAGAFREDLYYRINGLTVTLPPLRERDDFDAVLHGMLTRIGADMGRSRVDSVHPGLLRALRQHTWPGNLRQLHGVLRTACALLPAEATGLDWSHLPHDTVEELQALAAAAPPSASSTSPTSPADASAADLSLRKASSQVIRQVLQATGGNLSESARRLGISRNTLYRWLRKHGEAHRPGP
jgi:transcriptional regulator of acetoin/glycerol metabolism